MTAATNLYNIDDLSEKAIREYLAHGVIKSPVAGDPVFLYHGRMIDYDVDMNWTGNEYPFEYLDYPKSKVKYTNHTTFYFLLNNDCSYAIIFPGTVLVKSTVFEKNGNLYYRVPLIDCRVVKL